MAAFPLQQQRAGVLRGCISRKAKNISFQALHRKSQLSPARDQQSQVLSRCSGGSLAEGPEGTGRQAESQKGWDDDNSTVPLGYLFSAFLGVQTGNSGEATGKRKRLFPVITKSWTFFLLH